MKVSRRYGIMAALTAAAVLMALGGCAEKGTFIIGSVSFLNYPGRTFPPAAHPTPGTLTDDVCYVRLTDNDGAGAVLWESPAYPVRFLDDYIYPPNATTENGVHIGSFVISLTNAELAAATMPLRLEAYLYDVEVAAPINPAANTEDYSYEGTEGDPGWHKSLTVAANTTNRTELFVTVPFP